MNKLALYLDVLEDGRSVEKDGLAFSNASIVKCWIDGKNLDDLENFQDSLIYFSELEESARAPGSYLIFTCACGIAEDGGWEGVAVKHNGDVIEWAIDTGSKAYRYLFNKTQYCDEIESLRDAISTAHLPLEPKQVIFPLNFHR